jgi:hypothetical protein
MIKKKAKEDIPVKEEKQPIQASTLTFVRYQWKLTSDK